MPMKPHKGEKEAEFLDRCIPEMSDAHPDWNNDRVAAACYSMFGEKSGAANGKTKQMVPMADESEDDFMARCTIDMDEDTCAEIWEGNEERSGSGVRHKTHSGQVSGMEFVLSDATPDRYGDIIVAEGWDLRNFRKNPIALFNHRADFPVGVWQNLRVVDGALRGHLKMAPDGTSPRIDEIRKLIEAGILKAVSVGFRPLESKPRRSGEPGELFVRSELVETSVVAVPANPNSLAVARSLKISADTLNVVFAKHGNTGRDAKGRGSPGKHAETPPVVRKSTVMSPLSQRIEDAQKRIVALQDQLDAHLKSLNDEDPDEASIAVTEELTQKIATQQKAHAALVEAEKKVARSTVEQDEPADNGGSDDSKTKLVVKNHRPFASVAKKVEPVDYFFRAAAVALKHYGERGRRSAIDVIKESYGEDEPTRLAFSEYTTKTASAPATTTTSHWASDLVTTINVGFENALMPVSIFPQLSSRGRRFTFGREGVISLPLRDPTTTIAGSFVLQGAAIPVRQGLFASVTLTPKKLGVISTFTREIAEHSTPAIEGIIRQTMLEDTGVAIDSVLLDATAASATRPAGLRDGVSTQTPTGGGAVLAAIVGDLKLMINALSTASNGNMRKPVWLMRPSDALTIAMMPTSAGNDMPFREEVGQGTLFGIPIIQSSSVTADTIYLIDAADFVSVVGSPRFDVSDQAVLHMEDTSPSSISSTATPGDVNYPVRSLWQTDSIGIRLLWEVNWSMLRTGMVQYTTPLGWN